MKFKPADFLLILTSLVCGCNREMVSITKRGTFTDSRDDNVYKWVKIGNQTWMAENLAYLPSVSPSRKGSGFSANYYVYGYEGTDVLKAQVQQNYSTYGVLYNWVAARTACPAGWHLPNDKEWKALETRLGMERYDADITGWRETASIGRALVPDTVWHKKRKARNRTGFLVIMGGYRTPFTGFQYLGTTAVFWTASSGGPEIAWSRTLGTGEAGVSRITDDRSHGFSVRCLKN